MDQKLTDNTGQLPNRSKVIRERDLTAGQLDGIRRNVLAGIAEIEQGEFIEINGRQELDNFMDDVKARGRQRAAARKA